MRNLDTVRVRYTKDGLKKGKLLMLRFNFVNNNMCVYDDEYQDYGVLGCNEMYE
jgi:hypothetical protein